MSSRPIADARSGMEEGGSANAGTLRLFSEAWSRGDVDALMALMSDDPTYRGSAGSGPGSVYRGREEVRAAFTRMLAGVTPPAGSPPPPGEMVFFGNRALSFWKLAGRAPDGTPATIEGVDVMTFDDRGRIAVKDAYRKTWG